MKTPDWYVFKDFLDLAPNNKQLIQLLSSDEKEDIELTPSLPFHPSKGIASHQERLQDIHYSWFIPYLERLSDTDRPLFIAPLHEQKASLYQHFDLLRPVESLTQPAIDFICQKLYEYLTKNYSVVLPKECLPEDPLNALLQLSREKLLHMVDLLSLHDLSLEIKTLISSAQLLKIESLLSHSQKTYLHELRKKIEPIAFKPIGLSRWNGDEALLKKILHQRGLNRLSKALSASHHSLLWHLSHKLDMGRASIVKALFKTLKNKKAHHVLVSQVCDLAISL